MTRIPSKRIVILALLALLLTSCHRMEEPHLPDSVIPDTPTDTTDAPDTPADTTDVSEAEPIGYKAEVRDTYTDEPYAFSREGRSVSDDIEGFLKLNDWDSLSTKIPDSYYESYPDCHTAPDSAVLHKDGETVKIAVDDPRLIKLLNFYNNCIYHEKYAGLHGAFSPAAFAKRMKYPVRLELHFSDIGQGEASFEAMYVVYDPAASSSNGWCGMVVYSSAPYATGVYSFYATSRVPLAFYSVNWLELFEFTVPETEAPDTPADTTDAPDTPAETTDVPETEPIVYKAEVRDTYTDEPYALSREGLSVSEDIEGFLKLNDWDSISAKIPDSYYESYPDCHTAPDSAVLHKDGETVEIAVDDPRLIKLLNFYNNCRHHVKYAWLQGAYPPDDFAELMEYPVRLELHFADIGKGESCFEAMYVVYDPTAARGAGRGEMVVYSSVPYANGLYPFYATSRVPLSFYAANWLELFGF